jgi:anaerobic selenocysteine-containing dehydrogenase
MTFGTTDRLMGIQRRDMILISPEDAERLGLKDNDKVLLRSDTGGMNGLIQLDPVKCGTLQAYCPEANVLISPRPDPVTGETDYNAEVSIEKAIEKNLWKM